MRFPAPVPIPLEQLGGDRLLQSRFWARLKQEYGWRPFAFRLGDEEGQTLLVLYRRFAPGAAIGYIPHPAVPRGGSGMLSRLSADLTGSLPPDTMLLRWDPAWEKGDELDGCFNPPEPFKPLRKAPVDIQPPDTVIIDLEPGEEELLAAMKPKTRYNIRLAFRKGVEVVSEGAAGLETWYRLYRETAVRDRIAIHPESYYRTLFRLAEEHPEDNLQLDLLMARADGEALAGIIVSRFGGTATYMYGASANDRRNLMPAYALQWQAMQTARAAGCGRYDLFGIPPADDPSHPMHGLFRFKTGFGGRIVHRPGCVDFILRPLRAGAYRNLEKLRRWYFLEFKKRGKR